MKFVFCGGGTAGHITPALAIIEAILKKDSKTEILFVGREGGEENTAVIKAGIRLKTVEIYGLERRLSINNLKKLLIARNAKKTAINILKDFSPNAVIGTGGYVSWPILSAAQKLNIHTVIHESNACPGLVTKLLAPKCDLMLLNLKGTETEFRRKDNIKIVGNPIREDFYTLTKERARKKLGIGSKQILISSFGGSGGSQKINDAIIKVMLEHSEKNKNINHIHSCGRKYYNEILKKHPKLTQQSQRCIIKPYIENMSEVLSASDIVISRCGAMTLSEIAATGAAAILIPSPNVTNDHQLKNAELLCKNNAALMIKESELNESRLIELLTNLEKNERLRNNLSSNIKENHNRNAKNTIADEIFKLIGHSASN